MVPKIHQTPGELHLDNLKKKLEVGNREKIAIIFVPAKTTTATKTVVIDAGLICSEEMKPLMSTAHHWLCQERQTMFANLKVTTYRSMQLPSSVRFTTFSGQISLTFALKRPRRFR